MFNLYNYLFKIKKNNNINKNINKNQEVEKIDYFKLKKDFENNECIICLDNMIVGNNIKALQCGHIYHYECINKWFNVKKECPICIK